MKKSNLLSIGELSKITGVHIKALRYYDSLNILKPEYVDPDSGYRYYAFQQKAVVDAIQFCVDIGVPLKQFGKYANKDNDSIFYADLVRRGTALLEERITQMQERLERLKAMKAEINRAEVSLRKVIPDTYDFPERNCWIFPYEGALLCEDARAVSKKVILEVSRCKLRLGNTYGLLLKKQDSKWKQFLFVDIHVSKNEDLTELLKSFPQMMHIPAGRYMCKTVNQSGIGQVWDWSQPYLTEDQIQLILETELFVGDYHFLEPVLEQRCFLSNQGKNHKNNKG